MIFKKTKPLARREGVPGPTALLGRGHCFLRADHRVMMLPYHQPSERSNARRLGALCSKARWPHKRTARGTSWCGSISRTGSITKKACAGTDGRSTVRTSVAKRPTQQAIDTRTVSNQCAIAGVSMGRPSHGRGRRRIAFRRLILIVTNRHAALTDS